MSERSSFDNIIKWIIVAVLAVLALKVALSVLGLVFFAGAILWKLLPIILFAWLVVKAIGWIRGRNGGSAAPEPTEPGS
ncbi:MAG TPA: hypothetical protein VFX98_04145 [Longimicrobiaceae bacterium]|nr:hypothetical protein [Longimicrobiaceae bacterium]